MCLIHDLGECFTGDIPTFEKTDEDTATEDDLLAQWGSNLPQPYRYDAVISHNESPLSTWLPLEYRLNLTYGNDNVAFSPI